MTFSNKNRGLTIFLIVWTMTALFTGCKDPENQKINDLAMKEERNLVTLINSLVDDNCAKQSRADKQSFYYDNTYDGSDGAKYRIYGERVCDSFFVVRIPIDKSDTSLGFTEIKNYKFYETILIDSNRHRILDLKLTRQMLLNDPGFNTDLLITGFKQTHFDDQNNEFEFGYYLTNLQAGYDGEYVAFFLDKQGTLHKR
jgi:hypothetical protein